MRLKKNYSSGCGAFMKINYLSGESKEAEYKREYSKTLLKTVSAFSNYNDGLIVVGISDKGEVVGVSDINDLKEQIENAIYDSILPNPYYEMETDICEGKTVLILKVFKSENTPYTYNGKAFKRVSIITREVDLYEYNELVLNGKNLTYDEMQVNDAELDLSVLNSRLKKTLEISDVDKKETLPYKIDRGNFKKQRDQAVGDGGVIEILLYKLKSC